MDFRDTPEEAAFRDSLRRWLRDHLPDDWAERDPGVGLPDEKSARHWTSLLHEAGYAGLTWPREYGGAGAPYTFQGIYLEEAARAHAPDHIGVIGLGMAGPTIMAFGRPDQKEFFLPRILSGEVVFCQGFSEPGSGSDLASIRTAAVRDGDHYVVDGQKVWSSYAHIADWCILLTRSDRADGNKHAGLTYLLLDMRSPGVEVRPLRQITGDPEFNEIFFTDVRVPVTNRLGDEGDGWRVAMTTLLHERATLGFALTGRFEQLLYRLIETAKRQKVCDAIARDGIAASWIDLQALRYTNYRALTTLMKTGMPGPEGSVVKLHWSEANQRLTSLAQQILGSAALLDGDGAFWNGFWTYQQLRSRGNTIEAGTSEILRNIIAERVVGLPRSR